jgi:predicted signal transduction protein with EAL and GGDEF domain
MVMVMMMVIVIVIVMVMVVLLQEYQPFMAMVASVCEERSPTHTDTPASNTKVDRKGRHGTRRRTRNKRKEQKWCK